MQKIEAGKDIYMVHWVKLSSIWICIDSFIQEKIHLNFSFY